MRYFVVSDIHGDLAGVKTALQALNIHGLTEILCPGDVLYHGPRNDLPEHYAPKEVIPLLNERADHITAVRGNCDAEVDQMVLSFSVSEDYRVLSLNERTVYLTHGHVYGPDHLPPMREGDILLYGHTHIPRADRKDGIFLLNPGSISLPKEGHPNSYGILSDDGFAVYGEDHTEYMEIAF